MILALPTLKAPVCVTAPEAVDVKAPVKVVEPINSCAESVVRLVAVPDTVKLLPVRRLVALVLVRLKVALPVLPAVASVTVPVAPPKIVKLTPLKMRVPTCTKLSSRVTVPVCVMALVLMVIGPAILFEALLSVAAAPVWPPVKLSTTGARLTVRLPPAPAALVIAVCVKSKLVALLLM